MFKNLLFSIILLTTGFSYSQETTNSKFQLALSKYGSHQYEQALKLFREISSTVSSNQKEAALLFCGKSELMLERVDNARKTVVDFLILYPSSPYRDEARITLSKIYLEKGDPSASLKELLYLMEETKVDENIIFARETGSKIATSHLTAIDTEEILSTTTGKKSKPFLLLLTGKLFLKDNNKLEADAAFLEIIEEFPDSDEKEEAQKLLKEKPQQVKIADSEDLVPVIAALLPLTKNGSSDQQNSIEEILEGIKYAVSEYNKNSEVKIGLLIRNTDNSPAEIEELRKELERIPSLKLILGPVYSDEVRAALRVFANKNIPLISPTATDDDLTKMNEYFFQANPSFALRGKAMAQYIFFVENKRKIGVINAAEGYSPAITLGFTSEFQRLGGEIIVRETYNSGSFELQDQARRISSYSGSLEGVFIPLSDKADAPVILNELLMNNVKVPIYGNQDWFYSKVYSGTAGSADEITFTSDHFIDYNNADFQVFAKNFNLITSKDANRNVLYGYDAAKFILNSVKNWNQTSLQIKRDLESGVKMDGFHNDISFDSDRVNVYLNIVRFKEGIFELVDTFKTSTK